MRLAALALLVLLSGCGLNTTRPRSYPGHISAVGDPSKWAPVGQEAPVLWLWSDGTANLTGTRYVSLCVPGFGQPANVRHARGIFKGSWTPGLLAPYGTVSGVLVSWLDLPDSLVVSGSFHATWADSDNAWWGSSTFVLKTACGTRDTLTEPFRLTERPGDEP